MDKRPRGGMAGCGGPASRSPAAHPEPSARRLQPFPRGKACLRPAGPALGPPPGGSTPSPAPGTATGRSEAPGPPGLPAGPVPLDFGVPRPPARGTGARPPPPPNPVPGPPAPAGGARGCGPRPLTSPWQRLLPMPPGGGRGWGGGRRRYVGARCAATLAGAAAADWLDLNRSGRAGGRSEAAPSLSGSARLYRDFRLLPPRSRLSAPPAAALRDMKAA